MLRSSRLFLILALAVPAAVVTLVAPSARAQQPASGTIRSQLTGPALEAWDRGQDAIDAKQWATAVPELRQAYTISRNPRVLFNIGFCQTQLGNYVDAKATFEKELAEGAATFSPEVQQQIKDAVASVAPYITTLQVTANEPGATLLIDEENRGTTPFLGPILVNTGANHKLVLHKDGFNDQVITKEFTHDVADKIVFAIEPTIKKSEVTVDVEGAPNAEVRIDATSMGTAPWHGYVVAGRHTFEARASGYVSTTQTSEVVYKTPLHLKLTLAQERHNARVSIDTAPAGGAIEIDGQAVALTHWEGTLPSGGHQLIVKKQGFEDYSSELALRDDQVRTVTATLVEVKSRTWIWWTVGAIAVIGGGAVASYFIFKPSDATPYVGTFSPGLTTGSFKFR